MRSMKKLINYFKKNAITVRNYLNLNIIYLSNVIIQLILIPILIRCYGLEGYGEYVFLFAFVNYSELFVKFGFDYHLLRFAVENRKNTDLINKKFGVSVFARLVIFTSILPFLILLINLVPAINGIILILLYFTLLKTVLVPLWYFQSINNLNIISIATFVSNIVLLLVTLTISRSNLPITYFAAVVLLTSWLQVAIVLLNKPKEFYLSVDKFNIFICDFKYLFKVSFLNFFSEATQLYTNFTKIIIGLFFTNDIVAIYEISTRIINFSLMPFATFNQSIYPQVLQNKNVKKVIDTLKIEILLIALVVLILFFMKAFIFQFFSGSDQTGNSYILTILSFTIFAVICNQVLGFHILYNFGYDSIRANGIIISSILYLFLLAVGYYLDFPNVLFILVVVLVAEFTPTIYYLGKLKKLKKQIQRKCVESTVCTQVS